jgi:RNA polymerase sigma factor for flagellar operon FliA
MVEPAVQELWREYAADPSKEARDKLLVYYAPLVKYVASRVITGLPRSVELGDLMSYGWFGLIDAIGRFDPAAGNKFETYAMQRIRGSVLDGLRASDWAPRTVRQSARAIETAMMRLEGTLARTPTEAELAEELSVTVERLRTMLTQVSNAGVAALDDVVGSSDGGRETVSLIDVLADRGEGPGGVYERQELKELLGRALDGMPEREKWVIALYYFEHFTLADIGRVLGVTESRVSQIHTKAMMHLRVFFNRNLVD